MNFDPEEFKARFAKKAAPAKGGFDPEAFKARFAKKAAPAAAAPAEPEGDWGGVDTAEPPDPRGFGERIADKIAGIGPGNSEPTAATAAGLGTLRGITMGFSDRLASVGGTIGDAAAVAMNPALPSNPNAGAESRAEYLQSEDAARDANPWTHGISTGAGGIVSSIATAPLFAAGSTVKAAKTVADVARAGAPKTMAFAPSVAPVAQAAVKTAATASTAAKGAQVAGKLAQPLVEGVVSGVGNTRSNDAGELLKGGAIGGAFSAGTLGVGHVIKEAIKKAPGRKLGNFIDDILRSEDGDAAIPQRRALVAKVGGKDTTEDLVELAAARPELEGVARVARDNPTKALEMVTAAKDNVGAVAKPAYAALANAEDKASLTLQQVLNRWKIKRGDMQKAINSGSDEGSELERKVLDDLIEQASARFPGDPHKTRVPIEAIRKWSTETTSNVANSMGAANMSAAKEAKHLTASFVRELKRDRIAELAQKGPGAAAAAKLINETTDPQFAMLYRMENALKSKAQNVASREVPWRERLVNSTTGIMTGVAGTAGALVASKAADPGMMSLAVGGAAAMMAAKKYGPKAVAWTNDYLLAPMAENIKRGGAWKDISDTMAKVGVGAGLRAATLEKMYHRLQTAQQAPAASDWEGME